MPRYRPVTRTESETVQHLRLRFGDQTFRALFKPENPMQERPEQVRLLDARRLDRLVSGRGKLTEQERETLAGLRRNQQAVTALQNRSRKLGNQEFRTNRALRTWLQGGKQKNEEGEVVKGSTRGIKALRYLGVDNLKGVFYLK